MLIPSRILAWLTVNSATNYLRKSCRDRGGKTSRPQCTCLGEAFFQRQWKGRENPAPLSCPQPELPLLMKTEPEDFSFLRRLFIFIRISDLEICAHLTHGGIGGNPIFSDLTLKFRRERRIRGEKNRKLLTGKHPHLPGRNTFRSLK